MSAEFEATMAKADEDLQAGLQRIFGQIASRMIPDGKIESIHSSDYAEDGITFCIMLDMVGGGTVMISLAPGEPITACVVA